MTNFIECKVSYEKMLETGMTKKVTETYIVDAISCSEAEARVTEELTPYVEGEFTVKAVKKDKIAELFQDPNGSKFYRCKVMFITLDEKSGVEKKSPSTMAVKNLNNGMKGTMSDWSIHTIAESNIIEVFIKSDQQL